ncbi:hypothetical protein JCM15519_08920 [Fundidesulfovibrio butyratiphilus]
MLLYVHVPFCRSKCRYCAFSSETLTMDALEAWQIAVCKEISRYGARLGRPEAQTLYFGGGTPSLLPDWAFERVFAAVDKAFALVPGAEVTLEANPDSARDRDMATLWKSTGVNRISLGVQSFLDSDLLLLGRPHTAGQVRSAVETLRQAGFANLSLDLIFGLPGQRLKTWRDNLKAAVRLKPEHLSCYGLTLEDNTPLERAVSQGAVVLPDDDEQAKMYVYGGDWLELHGFVQYEISNYARMGFSSRHNQGYWDGLDYLGFGPSAVSTLNGLRWENPKSVADYVVQVDSGKLAVGAVALTEEERWRERLMLALRTAKGVNLAAYKKLTGRDLLAREGKLLTALYDRGLIRLKDGCLRLTRQGMVVSNTILTRLLFPDDE